MSIEVKAVTFDDFRTLRHAAGEKEDIVHPIVRALREEGLDFREEDFLKAYFRIDKSYRERKKKTLREDLLDDMIAEVLESLGCVPRSAEEIRKAVDAGLMTREARWYPDSIRVLMSLREKGYGLGLISNTHWRLLDDMRRELERYFEVITLSCEHGYAKPHPSIFTVTLRRLRVSPGRCLHVGDDPEADIKGAKGCGIKTAFVKRGTEEADSDLQIGQLSDLLALL